MPEEAPLYINPSLPIREAFSSLPAGFKNFLKSGFAIVAALTEKGKTADVLNVVLDEDSSGAGLSRTAGKEISTNLGINADDVPELIATVTFCVSIFIQQATLSAAEFVSAGVEMGFIDSKQQTTIKRFIDFVVENRASSSEITERKRLTARLLPMLTRFSTVVDIRPGFTDDETSVKFSVPVVIARIENDSTTDDLWMQMSKRQVERLIIDLQEVLRKVEIAEKWSRGNTAS